MRTGYAPREYDRRSVAEPAGHDLDLFLRGRIILEAIVIAAVSDRDIGDRPALRRVDQHAVGIEHIGAGDVGPAAGLCAQHLVHRQRCHLAAEDIRGFDAMAFEFRDDALLQHREILELAVEVAGEHAHGVFQAVAAAFDRTLPEAVDDQRCAEGGCGHQHEAADDQPRQRRSPPTAKQRAHPRGPSN